MLSDPPKRLLLPTTTAVAELAELIAAAAPAANATESRKLHVHVRVARRLTTDGQTTHTYARATTGMRAILHLEPPSRRFASPSQLQRA